MKYSKYSAIIIGSGIAGLYSALKLEQELDLPNGILLITKKTLLDSNSYYAQGGMVAVLKENTTDSVELHISDTLKAGAGLSELNSVKFISENSNTVVNDLLNFGVEFDRNENGDFTLTKEAAHSVRRILHAGGDATGREMSKALATKVKNNKKITIYENTMVTDLIVENKKCSGVISFNETNDEYETINSPIVIVATGGLGQLYKYTTNPSIATGDGFALCYRAGAELRDMEFVQFHPTALASDILENRFLISEAVRGEGAKLCDINGKEFMHKYDEKKELAPRDIVARSIFKEMKATSTTNVYLNATILGKEKLAKRFPTIGKTCLKCGIDITKDYIPVSPAAHYFMGGVKTNLNCETNIFGLFAIGEVASIGLHGANRLASNSLLECVVCAYKVSEYIKENFSTFQTSINNSEITKKYQANENIETSKDLEELRAELKNIMWDNVGIFRNQTSLEVAQASITDLKNRFNRTDVCANINDYEFRNMLIVAELIINSALKRKESRGAHFRTDYNESNEIGNHSLIKNNEGEISFAK